MPIKIGKWVKGWRLDLFFKKLLNKVPPEIKKVIHIGVLVAENINKFINSDVADVITAIIPGELDDKIKEKLRQELPRILSELKLADACGALTDPNEIVQCAINTLKQIAKEYRVDFLDAIAVHASVVAADGKLTWDDVKYLTKVYYDMVHNGEAGAAEASS